MLYNVNNCSEKRNDVEKELKKLKDKLVFDTIYYRKLIYEIYNRKDNSFFLSSS
ncbi:hypothetical protein C8J95_103204 [Elizabethkingia sp. YR214]|nr:hypothetical protein C8J95_103204 [Elizabethkingia sp. YR214]